MPGPEDKKTSTPVLHRAEGLRKEGRMLQMFQEPEQAMPGVAEWLGCSYLRGVREQRNLHKVRSTESGASGEGFSQVEMSDILCSEKSKATGLIGMHSCRAGPSHLTRCWGNRMGV